MVTVVLLLLTAFILWLNIKASLLILNDLLSETKQRTFQLLLVWLLPLVGAFLVLAIHKPTENSSGKYPEESLQPDEFSGRKRESEISDDD